MADELNPTEIYRLGGDISRLNELGNKLTALFAIHRKLMDQANIQTVRKCLDIIAKRRIGWYDRHDEIGQYGCRALDGASHEIAQAFDLLADQEVSPPRGTDNLKDVWTPAITLNSLCICGHSLETHSGYRDACLCGHCAQFHFAANKMAGSRDDD